MKNMECLNCGYEFEGFIGDECPNCKGNNKQVVDKKELENNIPKYKVICICNTEVEVEEHSVGQCPNCGREIDDKGVIQ